jgi:hypothetical protein
MPNPTIKLWSSTPLVCVAVEARNNDNFRVRCTVDQAVWKSTDSSTAELPPDDLILQWILLDGSECTIHGKNELGAKSGSSPIIPVASFSNFDFGHRPNYELKAHL